MWTFNGIRITVVDSKETNEQILAKLQPVDAGTVYQTFGYINDSISLQCYIVGSGDVGALKALTKTGTAYDLSWDSHSFGNFYLDKMTVQWLASYKQTFRPDKSDTDLVFKGQMDLSKT